MYADRIEGEEKPSIRDRLNGNSAVGNSLRRRTVTGKRSVMYHPGQTFAKYHCMKATTDKEPSCPVCKYIILANPLAQFCEEHEAYLELRQRQDDKWEHDLYEDARPQISRKLGGGDLRLKLLRKSNQQDTQGGGVRDLREKLSGSMHSQPIKKDPPKPRPEAIKPARRSVIVEAPAAESKKVSDSVSRKKTQQKADASVDGFLRSLDLEKYLITFQAEEVDMTALEHMTDEDLKAMGIPMGPRKKIILALNSRS